MGDNRIRLDPPIVDFTLTDQTGQLHDSYPMPNTQARYDLMRTFLIGLLSNQSCDEVDEFDNPQEPIQKRTGTLWFKKIAKLLTIYDGEKFANLANYISIDNVSDINSLQAFIDMVIANLTYVAPRLIWSGLFNADEINHISIPSKFQGYAVIPNMHPIVYINGLLIDPRSTVIQTGSPSYIKLNDGVDPIPGQKYTVILEHVTEIIQEDILGLG